MKMMKYEYISSSIYIYMQTLTTTRIKEAQRASPKYIEVLQLKVKGWTSQNNRRAPFLCSWKQDSHTMQREVALRGNNEVNYSPKMKEKFNILSIKRIKLTYWVIVSIRRYAVHILFLLQSPIKRPSSWSGMSMGMDDIISHDPPWIGHQCWHKDHHHHLRTLEQLRGYWCHWSPKYQEDNQEHFQPAA